MADDTVVITFDNDLLTDQQGNKATLTGSVTVDYTTNSFSGSYKIKNDFSDNGGDYYGTLSQNNGVYTITTSESFTVRYTGERPVTISASKYVNDSSTYDTNNNPAGQRQQPVDTTQQSEPSDDTVCFAAGTRIRTVAGDVAVEDLAIGDVVVTATGAHRPIRWLGQRSYAGRFANRNPDVLPVCFKAGSIGDDVPVRDLWISPKHAMYLDGALVPAEHLVNGVTVIKAARVERVDYHHVELDSHDVLLAEGAPSESFVDDAGRHIFRNAGEHAALYPDAVRVEAVYCAPRIEHGAALEAIRRQIDARAEALFPQAAGARSA